jgi:hypothetical protein
VVFLLVVFLLVYNQIEYAVDHLMFFAGLAQRVSPNAPLVEDMGHFGFSTRHWQQI